MATFQTRIEALTGLTFTTTSTPTLEELGQFLVDGVLDFQSKYLNVFPGESPKFARETAVTRSQGLDLNGANVLTVLRESGADGDFRVCRLAFPGMESMLQDKHSIHYASKINPAYIQIGDAINVYPAPSAADGDGYKAYYVNDTPVNASAATLSATDSNIEYFPNNKEQFIVLYAAAESLKAKMLDYTIEEEDSELMKSLAANLQLIQQQYYENIMPASGGQKE